MTAAEAEELHQCAERCRPFGSAGWVRQAADRLGLGGDAAAAPSPAQATQPTRKIMNVPFLSD